MDGVSDILEDWPSVPHTASETSKKMHRYVMALVKIVKEQFVKIKELETKLASTEGRSQDPSRGTGTLWRHRYGVQPVGHPKAGQKFYWGIRWNELRPPLVSTDKDCFHATLSWCYELRSQALAHTDSTPRQILSLGNYEIFSERIQDSAKLLENDVNIAYNQLVKSYCEASSIAIPTRLHHSRLRHRQSGSMPTSRN
ncbi:hypothetical protein BpHYR1_006844 [Brachionus plicatilis]|uniref:Uncharacterized protein n=1 Tax=Brachionus plicatilis TaxID=10195 RepID=A0A3M7PA50_BRAPC|nr:hypothetical protein BpHYR1_006844 [Brachionus plicatilis]